MPANQRRARLRFAANATKAPRPLRAVSPIIKDRGTGMPVLGRVEPEVFEEARLLVPVLLPLTPLPLFGSGPKLLPWVESQLSPLQIGSGGGGGGGG